jgi:predicted cupin superfamily sugar epimerase
MAHQGGLRYYSRLKGDHVEMMTAEKLIEKLRLEPHPEGGYFRETYRCDESTDDAALSPRYDGGRSLSTAIYYLLTQDDFSAMHRILSDEIFHFYLGDPVTLVTITEAGYANRVTLGAAVSEGEVPQAVVPRGVWQGLCLTQGGRYALLGTTVAPGFDFRDFEIGDRSTLIRQYPDSASDITRLTRSA